MQHTSNTLAHRRLAIGGVAVLGIAAALLAPTLLHQQPDAEAAPRAATKKRAPARRAPVRKVTPQVAPASKSLRTMKGVAGLGRVVYMRQNVLEEGNSSNADLKTQVRLLDTATRADALVASDAAPDPEAISAQNPEVFNESPSLSPDGSRVAVIQRRACYDTPSSSRVALADIWVMEADGSNPTRLTSTQDDEAEPRWSPDGNLIAYTRLSSSDSHSAVRIMKADGSGDRLLLKGEECKHAAWSPDGKRLAVVTSGGLCVVNADGTGLRELPDVAGRMNRDTPDHPSWSPDGGWIAFELGQAFQPEDAIGPDSLTLYSSIYAVRADARGTRRSSRPVLLAGASTDDNAKKATENSYETPVWMPDGRILFVWKQRSKYDGATQKVKSDLWTMKADGSAKARLTESPGLDETTPDAR